MPRDLAVRVVTFDTLYATLDIAEVAADAKRPVEPVAAVYFDVANRLGLPWLREKIAALPGDAHWQMLAKSAMQDDLSGLQRALTGTVLASGRRQWRVAGETDRRLAGPQSPRARARGAAARRVARGAVARCGDAVGGAARVAQPGLTD